MGCARASGAKRPPFTTSSRSNFEGRSPPSPTSFNGQGCYLYSRKKGRPSPREPSAGEGARCPARATGATAAAARSDAPAPVASSRGRRTGRRFFRANAQPSGRVRTNWYQLISVLATGLKVLRLRSGPCSEPMSLAGIDGERKSGIDIRAEHVTVRRRRRFPKIIVHSCIYKYRRRWQYQT